MTDHCNLECDHCYSSSSPRATSQIETQRCVDLVSSLAAAGFRQLSISGGEPTLHPGLAEIVATAQDLGLHASVVTNGLVSSPRVLDLLSRCDSVAVSVDGSESTHDRLRKRTGSYRAALRTIGQLTERDCRVAIVSCITEESLPELPDLWTVAAELGVDLMQIRPLAPVGRGNDVALHMPNLDRLALTATVLAEISSGPSVHCDLVGSERLLGCIDAMLEALAEPACSAAHVLSPLVVDELGTVRPYAYNLEGLDLGQAALFNPTWLAERLATMVPALKQLHQRTRSTVERAPTNFVDWYELLVAVSRSASETAVVI